MRFVAMQSVEHQVTLCVHGFCIRAWSPTLGAKSALQLALRRPPEGRNRLQPRNVAVLSRIGYHKTLVAIVNKHARIIWALLVKGEAFDVRRLAPATEAAAT